MRRNPDYLMREVADTVVVVPVGAATLNFSGMITLNATGAFLWQLLEQEQTIESLTAAIVAEYEVTGEIACEDVEQFIQRLRSAGALLETEV